MCKLKKCNFRDRQKCGVKVAFKRVEKTCLRKCESPGTQDGIWHTKGKSWLQTLKDHVKSSLPNVWLVEACEMHCPTFSNKMGLDVKKQSVKDPGFGNVKKRFSPEMQVNIENNDIFFSGRRRSRMEDNKRNLTNNKGKTPKKVDKPPWTMGQPTRPMVTHSFCSGVKQTDGHQDTGHGDRVDVGLEDLKKADDPYVHRDKRNGDEEDAGQIGHEQGGHKGHANDGYARCFGVGRGQSAPLVSPVDKNFGISM
uniref:Uncharacterized protein n=1 Tax=Romanomermis culicivorax TaxID=13658 RepID=A0A915ITD9_ROMCU